MAFAVVMIFTISEWKGAFVWLPLCVCAVLLFFLLCGFPPAVQRDVVQECQIDSVTVASKLQGEGQSSTPASMCEIFIFSFSFSHNLKT